MFCLFFVLLLQSFFSRSVTALTVESNSPCHSTCGGGTTPGGALNCQDGGYNTTDKGRQMEACLECESTSTVANPSNGNDTGKTDLYWFICKLFPLSDLSASLVLITVTSQHEIYPRVLSLSTRHTRQFQRSGLLQPLQPLSPHPPRRLVHSSRLPPIVRIL